MIVGDGYTLSEEDGFIECPYSGAKVPWMCLRFCDNCIQKKYPKKKFEKIYKELNEEESK